jgi:thiol:disulfide interchange protein
MHDLILYSLFAFFAGITLNLMPCVLPVMPFKIQAVLREINSDLGSRIFAALALLAGSVGFFFILGIATVYLSLIWGELFQSSLFQGALILFLLFSAVVTFANWSLRLPQFLYRIPAPKYLGAILTGALAGILSTPCSGPFLGSVLAYSVTQPPAGAMVLFLSIGIGLAFPHVILLIWSGLLDRLRFSGPWTVQMKHVLGFIMLSGAVFFSQPLVPELVHTVGWVLLIGAIVIWTIFFVIKSSAWSQRIFAVVTLGIVAIFVMIATGGITSTTSELNWQPFDEKLVKQALVSGRPVMIEFTADWCLNCKVLEKTVFKSSKVAAAVQKTAMMPLRVDLTAVSEENKTLLARYQGYAIPYVVLIDAKGAVSKKYTGVFRAKTLVEGILKTGDASR